MAQRLSCDIDAVSTYSYTGRILRRHRLSVRTLGFSARGRIRHSRSGGGQPKKTMFYTYALQSSLDKTTYIGSTADLRERLHEHNLGKTKSIKYKLPYVLIYYEAYQTKTQARKREIELKSNGSERRKLFERLFR